MQAVIAAELLVPRIAVNFALLVGKDPTACPFLAVMAKSFPPRSLRDSVLKVTVVGATPPDHVIVATRGSVLMLGKLAHELLGRFVSN